MPLSPCCRRKYSKPCKCNSPCKPCDCRVQTEQCPPTPPCTTEDSDAASVQLYTPVIAAVPASKKCCCCCCPEVKPKKSLWQQLFGDRKCCSPCQKKKQEANCVCKPKKKQRCVPECLSPVCCNDVRPSRPPASKPCRPLCCCKKVKTCKCKSSKPSYQTPDSIFGCSFYCSVENRENRTKKPCCQCCCCCVNVNKSDQKRTAGHTTEATTEDEKIIKSYDYKSNTGNKSVTIANSSDHTKASSCNHSKVCSGRNSFDRTKPVVNKYQSVDKPSQSNFRIGLTFQNTETKYYSNNKSSECPPVERVINYNNHGSEGSSESTEEIITLEIRQSSGNVQQERAEEIKRSHEDNQRKDEESASITSKRRKLSSVKEENEGYKREPENDSQEAERKSREDRNMSEHTSGGSLQRKRERTLNASAVGEDYNLDKRVSEILRRLRTIENKINNIDLHTTDNKDFTFETDGNKSTISFHFKDGKYDDSFYNNKNGTKNNDRTTKKPDAVIEIRKTRSKSYSPNRKPSSTQISRYRYSRSLDRGTTRSQREKPKLVIKLPHGNKVSQGHVSMYTNNRVKHLSKDYQDSEWMEVSSELKKRKQIGTPCYCYDCVCRRIQC